MNNVSEETIRACFELYVAGTGTTEIADELNRRDIPVPVRTAVYCAEAVRRAIGQLDRRICAREA